MIALVFLFQRRLILQKNKDMEEKKSWGGSRLGAGRKKQGVKAVTFSASEEVWTYLSDIKNDILNIYKTCFTMIFAGGKITMLKVRNFGQVIFNHKEEITNEK